MPGFEACCLFSQPRLARGLKVFSRNQHEAGLCGRARRIAVGRSTQPHLSILELSRLVIPSGDSARVRPWPLWLWLRRIRCQKCRQNHAMRPLVIRRAVMSRSQLDCECVTYPTKRPDSFQTGFSITPYANCYSELACLLRGAQVDMSFGGSKRLVDGQVVQTDQGSTLKVLPLDVAYVHGTVRRTVHHGRTMLSGHYTNILWDHSQAWGTDDHEAARALDQFRGEPCLLWFAKGEILGAEI